MTQQVNDASVTGQAVPVRSAALQGQTAAEKSDAQRAEDLAAKYKLPEHRPDEISKLDAAEAPAEEDAGEEPAEEAEASPDDGEPEEAEEQEVPEDAQARKPKASASKLAQAAQAARAGAKKYRAQQAQARTVAQENEQLRQRLQQQESFQRQLMDDPVGVLKQLKFTEQELTERMVRANTPEERVAILEQRIEEERQERVRLERSIQEREQSQVQQRQIRAFWGRMHEEAAKPEYKHLSEQPESIVEWLTEKTFKDIRKAGEDPNDYEFEEIASVMDKWLAQNRRSAKAQQQAAQAAGKKVTRAAPKTLSAGHSSRKFSLPANFADLPDDKRMDLLNQQASKSLLRR